MRWPSKYFLLIWNKSDKSQTIKDIECVEEQVVVEVLVQMQEEGHVPLSQQEHTRPLYVEYHWIQFELSLQEELGVKGVGSYLDQLFPLFFLVAVIYLLAIKSDEVQAPPPLTSILIHLLMVKEDEVLQEDDFVVKNRTFQI